MDAVEKPSDVAERLRALQAKHGLTIQQMADRCGLPKRSLENYMNLRSPQRPGLDALAGIADGFNVSIDWLVGRSALKDTGEFTKEDYAFFCQSTVLRVLIAVVDAVKEDPHNAIAPEHYRIMGHELHDIAALSMLEFVRIVDVQADHQNRPQGYFRRHFQSATASAVERTGSGSLDALGDRKAQTIRFTEPMSRPSISLNNFLTRNFSVGVFAHLPATSNKPSEIVTP